MPPRAAKKATAGPGTKRAGRGRGTPKAQRQPEAPVEQPVEDEQVVEEVKEEVKVEEVVEEISLSVPDEKVAVAVPASDSKAEGKAEAKPEDKGLIPVEEEDEVKEDGDEYGKGGWLDLEDNDPEYEPEEYVDDEKDIEQDDIQEEGDDVEEVVGEGDMADEEMEGIHEELEGEEEDEHGQEEHADVDGTEEEEHHELFKERRKRKEFEVFVGGLDKDANEDDLRKVFSKVGEVTEVRLMMNPHTKKNKGFAFLRFATVEQAKRACTELKNPVVNGKQCGITPSQDNDTLFLGNICKTWTKEALKDKLKQYGVENIEDLTLVEDSNNEGMNRGFAFLEFSSRSDAMDAFKLLQKRDVVFGVDRPAKVSFADSFAEPGDEVMAQVKTVFVDGLPASWDEDRVRKILKKYGEIDKIELARNMPSAKRKDFGFVTFRTHDAAVTCAKIINNEELGEGETKAKVRARLSRPLQRGKGKHGARVNPRSGRLAPRGARVPWSRPAPRSLPLREARTVGRRLPPPADRGLKRPAGFRDRRPVMTMPARSRQAAPLSRSYDRRPIAPSYPKGGSRGYSRHEALPPRSRAPAGYGSKDAPDRRPLHKDDYYSRGYDYSDLPRGTSRTAARRPYVDDGYGQRFERPPPSYHEGRSRDYETISGSKRPYAAVDDLPPRYAEPGVRPSRSRLDYSVGGSASQYEDAYGDRLGRSSLGYGGGRSSASSQDPHGLYSSRHGMGYGEGSYGGGGGDGGSVYASSYGSSYASRGADVGGSSYSSLYSSRGLGGSSYMASGSSRSYY